MKISIYIATSLDGYIARENGGLDWLDKFNNTGEDFGYTNFMASVDVLVMGRKSFENVLTFGEWPYGEMRVVVLSSALKEIPENISDTVKIMNGTPEEIRSRLAEEGVKHIYLDGGETIQRFLRAGLVDEMIVTKIPVLIGKGIALFGALEKDIEFEHVETETFKSGLVQSRYRRRS